MNKQIERLKIDNKNLELKNKQLSEEKINNLQAIKKLEHDIINIKSEQQINNVDDINMNNVIIQYKNQINELTSQLNNLQSENMSLQQNRRSLTSSQMENSREYPKSVGGNDN